MHMQDTHDITQAMKGRVRGKWVSADGHEIPLFDRPNQLSYGCCTALASLMAGSTAYLPAFMGFIYGNEADSVPGALVPHTNRDVTWATLAAELGTPGVIGNIQIAPLTMTPSLATSAAAYDKNGVIFTAHTRAAGDGEYAFPCAAPYADTLKAGCWLYHALLLARPSPGLYVPLARVTLGDGPSTFHQKPDGFELALDWQISFL